MKVKVTGTFRYEGREYGEGSVVELPDSAARSIIEKGYGMEMEKEKEIPTIESGEIEEKRGPKWKKKVWISENRNLTVSVWPPGGKFDSPSVTLEENQRDDSGNWQSNRFYLPTGSTLLALSEHIKSAWQEIQKIRSEKKD